MELCIDCLMSDSGECQAHYMARCAKENEMVFTATTTFNMEKLTKKEIIREILYLTQKLINLKWYEFKKPYLRKIKYYFNELKKLKDFV